MSERSMTDSHGQPGILLTLSSVRSRRHSYHSQADSAGSIPVTRSKREQRCSTSESDWISQAGQRSFASENGTRAITRAISHLGECPWRLSVPKLTVRVRFPSPAPHAKSVAAVWDSLSLLLRYPSVWPTPEHRWTINGPSVGHRLPCQHPPSGSGSCSQSEDGKGRQQLLSRLKQRLGVLNSSLRLVMRGRLAGPSGVLELVASSPHRPKGPEPVAELGTESHLDYIVPA